MEHRNKVQILYKCELKSSTRVNVRSYIPPLNINTVIYRALRNAMNAFAFSL